MLLRVCRALFLLTGNLHVYPTGALDVATWNIRSTDADNSDAYVICLRGARLLYVGFRKVRPVWTFKVPVCTGSARRNMPGRMEAWGVTRIPCRVWREHLSFTLRTAVLSLLSMLSLLSGLTHSQRSLVYARRTSCRGNTPLV